MRTISMLLTLALLGSTAGTHSPERVISQTVKDPSNHSSLKGSLELSTTLVEQENMCSNRLSLKIRLSFKNKGKRPVILDRGSFIGRVMVARDLEMALAKKYELDGRFEMQNSGFRMPVESNFVVIRPGASYEVETPQGVGTFSISSEPPSSEDGLAVGSHFLQIEVGTWTFGANAEPLRRKWSSKGILWSSPLTSIPMSFVIEPTRPMGKCS